MDHSNSTYNDNKLQEEEEEEEEEEEDKKNGIYGRAKSVFTTTCRVEPAPIDVTLMRARANLPCCCQCVQGSCFDFLPSSHACRKD